ncbi:PD-(D/E)XK nuclease family protein [Priestia megaterium]|uniref:PD-(D/E)XK nuclease family protein n=1 Tax=Priestia megaterium TaxID=1404 RepID=UPI0011BB5FFC|nr:PD-(D/E)XK nuclease family protein [Priestia megaterium]QDZ80157.1 hypothetical protein D0440_12170 [Priestia megaterium]
MREDEMIQFIEEMFEENYELLRLEGGHSLTPFVKRIALQQVKLYWEKLRDVAENVSETEVKLTLPLQKTPKGKTYTIQGIVDVVKEDDKTVLYDIKTHDVDYVRCNQWQYEGQLNIYAHIWQTIQGQDLDGTSILATGQTEDLKRAFSSRDERRISKVLEEWQPEVPIQFTQDQVESTITSFGEVVDSIENYEFTPPSVKRLTEKVRGNKTFVDYSCRNCDVRFSCSSYREYIFTSKGAKGDFLSYYNDYGTGIEKMQVLEANLKEDMDEV